MALAALSALCLVAVAVWLARPGARSSHAAVAPSVPAPVQVEGSAPMLASGAGAEPEGRAAAPVALDMSVPTAQGLVLALVDADEAPLAAIELLLVDADGGAQRATTDAEGRARFEPRAGSGAVYFQVPAYMPQRRELELAAGERRIALDPGAEVSGWVTVDGAVPERALELELTSDHAFLEGLGISPSVADFLGLGDRDLPVSRSSTDALGRFAFGGLAANWSGAILVPKGHALRGSVRERRISGERRVALQRPESAVAIELERLLQLTGHVRRRDGGEPEDGTKVNCVLEWPDGSQTHTMAACESDGRFLIVLREDDFLRVGVDVRSPSGYANVQFARAEIGGDLDLGDILLEVHQTLVFRAVDRDGAPIAGALGQVTGPELATTDADGIGRIEQVSAGRAVLKAVARGYSAAEVEVEVPSAAPEVVTLERTNRLSLLLENSSGVATSELRVVLDSGTAPLFPRTGEWFPDYFSLHLVRFSMQVDGTGHGCMFFLPNDEDRIELQELAVGTPLVARVVDALDAELLAQAIAPLAREEQREVVLQVTTPLRSIAGTVRDVEGRGLPGAIVTLSSADGETARRSSDSSGSFVFEAIAAERVDMQAEIRGFAARVRRSVALAGARSEVDFVLEHGRTATVAVIDERGRPVDGGQLWAAQGDDPALWLASRLEPGRFELRDASPDDLRLDLVLGGRSYAGRLASGESSATIQVPVQGRIEASWVLPEGEELWDCVRVLAADGVELVGALDPSRSRVVEFPNVLPGSYEVALKRWANPQGLEALSPSQTVVVEPDSTTSVLLKP